MTHSYNKLIVQHTTKRTQEEEREIVLFVVLN